MGWGPGFYPGMKGLEFGVPHWLGGHSPLLRVSLSSWGIGGLGGRVVVCMVQLMVRLGFIVEQPTCRKILCCLAR